jgi:DNA-binding CsgD family transcriptional regulator
MRRGRRKSGRHRLIRHLVQGVTTVTVATLAGAGGEELSGRRPFGRRVSPGDAFGPRVAPGDADGGPPPPEHKLTKRELEVLGLMAAGATNAEIADRLVIAQSTVQSHVKHILRKFDARNRTEAVSKYLSH